MTPHQREEIATSLAELAEVAMTLASQLMELELSELTAIPDTPYNDDIE